MRRIAGVLLAVALLATPAARGTTAQEVNISARQAQQFEENWIASLSEHGPSHASGGRLELGPALLGHPIRAVVTLRVGLSWSYTPTGAFSEFASLSHPVVRLSNTAGAVHILDRASGRRVAKMAPRQIWEVTWNGAAFVVTAPDGTQVGEFDGPIFFRPTSRENLFRIDSIERTNILGTGRLQPMYRGAVEIARGSSTFAGRVNLVNVVELESYVPGVVTNESPASFHVEALKAQATAARGYAVANVGRYGRLGYPFDIVDSSASQVYRGYTSEHVRGVQAAAETRGLVASYAGDIITAFYSSSFGGHSENVEAIFGGMPQPYLVGIYDGEEPVPDLTDPTAFDFFWRYPQPQMFDACERVANRFARYRLTVTAESIRSRLPGRFVPISGSTFDPTTSVISGIEVTERMAASARVAAVRISFTTADAPGLLEVRGWDNLRRVIGAPTSSTPPLCAASNIAAGFVLNNPTLVEPYLNAEGSVGGVTVWGGGWGHNVGLSQYGAHGRGLAGQTFLEILKAYYRGVDIGTYPIQIGHEPGSGPPNLRQQFSAPTGRGVLEIRSQGLKGLRIHFNETYDIILSEADVSADIVRIDVTPYLVTGLNVVKYNPVGISGWATVTVIVE